MIALVTLGLGFFIIIVHFEFLYGVPIKQHINVTAHACFGALNVTSATHPQRIEFLQSISDNQNIFIFG